MKNKKTIAIGVGTFIVGVFIGIYMGVNWGAKPVKLLQGITTRAYAAELASMQYHSGNYPEAIKALEQYIKIINEYKKDDDYWIGEKGKYFDEGMAYGRLALISEKLNNINNANAYWEKSESIMKKSGHEDFNKSKIKEFILRIDSDWWAKTKKSND